MGNRYHYDKDGRYKGMTSDDPPANDGCVWAVLFAIVFVCLSSGGC